MKSKATAPGKRAMKMAMASAPVKKRPSSATTVSDSLWESDPALAASLALVPLDNRTGDDAIVDDSRPSDSRAIERHLPPKLAELKSTGAWDKTSSGAVPEYLCSLRDRYGFDVDGLIQAYTEAKPKHKKGLAEKLVLCKTGGDLRCAETDFNEEHTTRETRKGWVSCFRVWAEEAIPITPETQMTRIACLAVLPRKPHTNPIRAKMGEFLFQYERAEMDSTKEIFGRRVETSAITKLKDVDDLKSAKKAQRKAFTDGVSDAVPKKAGEKNKMIKDLDDMSPAEKNKWLAFDAKKTWLKDAKSIVGKLSKEQASMHKTRDELDSSSEVPKQMKDEFKTGCDNIDKIKSELNSKVNEDNITAVGKFTSAAYKKMLQSAIDFHQTFTDVDFIHKRAKRAIQLTKV